MSYLVCYGSISFLSNENKEIIIIERDPIIGKCLKEITLSEADLEYIAGCLLIVDHFTIRLRSGLMVQKSSKSDVKFSHKGKNINVKPVNIKAFVKEMENR